jgi:hypothetical protein
MLSNKITFARMTRRAVLEIEKISATKQGGSACAYNLFGSVAVAR